MVHASMPIQTNFGNMLAYMLMRPVNRHALMRARPLVFWDNF